VIGPLLAYTITLPLGYLLAESAARAVFLPQIMPDSFLSDTATLLLLRPREFLANARDLVTLKAAVAEQAPRYPDIAVPTVVITGAMDKTVSPSRHSRPLASAVPNAELIVLPDVGHMIQNVAAEFVVSVVEAMIDRLAPSTTAAAAGRGQGLTVRG
jgi:pimeloyl-ACP methyl ester carboxylesterase